MKTATRGKGMEFSEIKLDLRGEGKRKALCKEKKAGGDLAGESHLLQMSFSDSLNPIFQKELEGRDETTQTQCCRRD